MTITTKKDPSNSRFSDEKLQEFQEEFRDHVMRCEERFNDGDRQFGQLIQAQQRNTEAISLLIDETRAIVQLHRDFQGVARVGVGAQKLVVWLAKLGFVGISLAAIINWLANFLDKIGGPTP